MDSTGADAELNFQVQVARIYAALATDAENSVSLPRSAADAPNWPFLPWSEGLQMEPLEPNDQYA